MQYLAMVMQMRYEACYVHVMQVLKFLINPGTVEGEAASVEREARMSIADRSVARKVLLQVSKYHTSSLVIVVSNTCFG